MYHVNMTCMDIQQFISQISLADGANFIVAIAATVAAIFTIHSYLLSKRIYDEVKSDEDIVAGPVHRVGYLENDHDDPVVRVTLFNRSSRKAFVMGIKMFDQSSDHIPVMWSNSASSIGNIENPTGLIGLVDSTDIYIRRNDGEPIHKSSFLVSHSFSETELVLEFDPYQS